MASALVPVRPVTIRACAAAPGPQRPDAHSRNKKAASNWWSPLFGWSAEPDYIGSDEEGSPGERMKERRKSESDLDPRPVRSRLAPGGFTEEKARQLRMLTTDTFHDAMYHSAIASRLASDFKRRSDQ
ncbi:hypothetical protein Tsubulata_025544 [Turnera subulata]|uniref:Uncharacterized protein n=1 Tax=Turnera subulata TaxID=218843 RepID=A0A9Q0FA58_9ROSI|nr:hypothetical protein Tsubulata_025544 [Turnera subulata]